MASDSSIVEKLAEIKDAFDEYFRKLSLGELIEPPLKQIEELPEMDEVGKELEKLAAECISEENEDSEQASFATMRSLDDTARLYGVIRRLEENRLDMLSASINNGSEEMTAMGKEMTTMGKEMMR